MKFYILTVFVCMLIEAIKADSGVCISHFGVENFDVEVKVEYDTTCSSKTNFNQLINGIPRGSSVLNVLERANQFYPTFNGFKLLYLANSSYHLISLNGDADTTSCGWIFSTEPKSVETSSSTSLNAVLQTGLNNVYISNIGMIVTFKYVSTTVASKWSHDMPNTKLDDDIPWGDINPAVSVEYEVQYSPSTCPNPNIDLDNTFPSTPTSMSLVPGSSALNVMERGANLESSRHFVISNVFGMFYVVESLEGASKTQNCQWCAYFSPSVEKQTPEYLLTADINNFIIPISGGKLILKYEQSCSSSAHDSFNRDVVDYCDINMPLPHYNPFMKQYHGSLLSDQCRNKKSCHIN